MKFVFNDGGRSETRKGHTGDCVCRSIAIATGKPYEEIYAALAEGNASERKSTRMPKGSDKWCKRKRARYERSASHGIHTSRKWFKDYMKSLGFEWTPTMKIGQGTTIHLRDGELPMGRLVVAVSGHYTAVIDGVIHDLYDPSREGNRCVYGYYKFHT